MSASSVDQTLWPFRWLRSCAMGRGQRKGGGRGRDQSEPAAMLLQLQRQQGAVRPAAPVGSVGPAPPPDFTARPPMGYWGRNGPDELASPLHAPDDWQPPPAWADVAQRGKHLMAVWGSSASSTTAARHRSHYLNAVYGAQILSRDRVAVSSTASCAQVARCGDGVGGSASASASSASCLTPAPPVVRSPPGAPVAPVPPALPPTRERWGGGPSPDHLDEYIAAKGLPQALTVSVSSGSSTPGSPAQAQGEAPPATKRQRGAPSTSEVPCADFSEEEVIFC